MALTEEQIVRFSRQILLRDVGGKGQERLLGAAVSVEGEGAAVTSAIDYLQAGGSRAVRGGSDAANHQLFVSADRIAILSPGGCPACFAALKRGAPSDSVALGALAALVVQRAALGISTEPIAAFALDDALELQREEPARCAHR